MKVKCTIFFCGTHAHSSFDVHSHFMNNINVGTQKKTAIFFVDACVCLNVNHAFFHSLQRVIATWKRHNIELHWVEKTEGKNIKNTSQVANWYARRMNNFHKIFKNKKKHTGVSVFCCLKGCVCILGYICTLNEHKKMFNLMVLL